MPTEQEIFDRYFCAALTGLLANPANSYSVSQPADKRTGSKQTREQIVACAFEYACLAMDFRIIDRSLLSDPS